MEKKEIIAAFEAARELELQEVAYQKQKDWDYKYNSVEDYLKTLSQQEPAKSGGDNSIVRGEIASIIAEMHNSNTQFLPVLASTSAIMRDIVEPLQRELKSTKHDLQTMYLRKNEAQSLLSEANKTISRLEAEIAELKKTEPAVSKEWEE